MAKGPIYLDTTGLKEALAGMDRLARLDAGKDLKAEFNKIVAQAISYGQAGAQTRAEQKAARTMREASTASGAVLSFGRGFAGALGTEFGAQQNMRRHRRSGSYLGYNQFRPWSGNGMTAGYFMYPGVRRAAEEGAEELADAVVRILEGAR
jgi:hypothetical protein